MPSPEDTPRKRYLREHDLDLRTFTEEEWNELVENLDDDLRQDIEAIRSKIARKYPG